MALLVPIFDAMRFPDYGTFNYRGERSDRWLQELVEHVAADAGLESHEIYLFGLGAGGDFVQRYTLAYPQTIARAAFAAKEFTLPDPNVLFPEGTKRNLRVPDLALDFTPFVKSDVAIVVEDQRSPGRETSRYLQTLHDYAEEHGLTPRYGVRAGSKPDEVWKVASEFMFKTP